MVDNRELLLMSEEKFRDYTKERVAQKRQQIKNLRSKVKQRRESISKFRRFTRSFKGKRNPLARFQRAFESKKRIGGRRSIRVKELRRRIAELELRRRIIERPKPRILAKTKFEEALFFKKEEEIEPKKQIFLGKI